MNDSLFRVVIDWILIAWSIGVFWFVFFFFKITRQSLNDGLLKTTQYTISRKTNPFIFRLALLLSWLVTLGAFGLAMFVLKGQADRLF
jgi:hypothetical protein